jgi:hypothetical protein
LTVIALANLHDSFNSAPRLDLRQICQLRSLKHHHLVGGEHNAPAVGLQAMAECSQKSLLLGGMKVSRATTATAAATSVARRADCTLTGKDRRARRAT